jgi:hypothetical protein
VGAAVSVKIFISCVTDEFRDYRDQLRTDLTRHNVEVKVQEDFKDYGLTTVENDDVYVRDCDAVIHLVGDMTGAMAQPESTEAILAKYPDLKEKFPPLRELLERGEDISYTQWEAWLALYHGKPLLIAQAADGAEGRGPDFAPTEASRTAQRAHLDRLRAVERFPGQQFAFGSVDQLARQIAYTTILDLLAKEREAARAPAHDANSFHYIALAAGLLVLLITPWLGEQWTRMLNNPLAGLLALAVAGGGVTLALVWSRYFGLLGASDGPVGSRDRMGYDTLHRNLATGGPATHLYARWLTAFLDRIDRFFGDAGAVDRTLFPHAFGLKTRAPLWTASSFDRCLLLALIYPIGCVFVIWATSGHVGPAAEALGLGPGTAGWQRALGVGAVAATVALLLRAWTMKLNPVYRVPVLYVITSLVLFVMTVVLDVANVGVFDMGGLLVVPFVIIGAVAAAAVRGGSGAIIITGSITGVIAGAILDGNGAMTIRGAIFSAVLEAGPLASAAACGFIVVASAVVGGRAGAIAMTTAIAIAVAWGYGIVAGKHPINLIAVVILLLVIFIADRLYNIAVRHGRQGIFLALHLFAMILICLGAVILFLGPRYEFYAIAVWKPAGALLFFSGLLTLINAPFDWASLGLTRALLRRGLELGGWWPYFLALADALAAAVLTALLAGAMVIGEQAFDHLAERDSPSARILILFDDITGYSLFDDIAANTAAPEYWWIYALLLSTMIPSLINLGIGGTALMRAVPGLSSLLLRFLPATGGVPTYDRAWIAAVLTMQAALGAVLGVAVQAAVAWGLIFHAMPAVGLGLLDLARGLAALDLPARVIAFFAGP